MMRRSLTVVIVLTATSCGLLSPPTELDHDARQLMTYLRSDRLESALAMIRISTPVDTLRKYLGMARDFVRPFPADSFTLVGWNVVYAGDTTGSLTYEARSAGRTGLFSVNVVRAGGAPAITAFHWQETKQPLAEANVLTLVGKTPTHYLYLLLAVLAALTCVAGAIFAGVQRVGIPWILISLIGVGSFSIDWSTGATSFNPLRLQVLAAGFVRAGPVAPWIVSWSIPLGAILMLIVWLRKGRARGATPTGAQSSGVSVS